MDQLPVHLHQSVKLFVQTQNRSTNTSDSQRTLSIHSTPISRPFRTTRGMVARVYLALLLVSQSLLDTKSKKQLWLRKTFKLNLKTFMVAHQIRDTKSKKRLIKANLQFSSQSSLMHLCHPNPELVLQIITLIKASKMVAKYSSFIPMAIPLSTNTQ
jgi:hypothetical protein